MDFLRYARTVLEVASDFLRKTFVVLEVVLLWYTASVHGSHLLVVSLVGISPFLLVAVVVSPAVFGVRALPCSVIC